ncbi:MULTISPECIES: DUF1846 domain-containing protein [unclassified Granulicatella]|uniref:DUF1846 domain-containing protein n=1 Tax=unclassified Granulicatella TaxID=2630493 RepID=UPI001074089D|nr:MULTISPECIES: DUF1846 domain-containing protein [unclassified Granulicatella]MBF0780241.1 DUF1846 domain-containing protein [Granulicatella sp. 19428wC4_WM01]TFU95675.1 DUF1846 domain-containing protein [Granulicatella sp. WM01]
MKKGFDSKQYLDEQSRYILERVNAHDKLYLEFGGKLIGDFHAMRVLPGFDPDGKVKLLYHLREKAEIIICVYAGDIEQNKVRSDFGITYDRDVLRLIDDLRYWDLSINSVVITRYTGQPSATQFKNKLERRGIKVYTHGYTQGYPLDVDTIVSDAGYGKNDYIETTKPLVVVTAPGPNSGKLATCLNQLYHEVKRGKKAGYAKFETFPIWNLPLKHPVNVAYESATADLEDVNMIDTFHLEKYNQTTVNYNRDIEAFPLLRRILTKINGSDIPYYSPTDMGVNRAGFAIVDDEAVQDAAKQEIIRRYFALQCDYKKGIGSLSAAQRGKYIMDDMGLSPKNRPVVSVANQKSQSYDNIPVVAIELADGTIITGKHSSLMSAAAACVLNCVKYLANISDDIHLLPPVILESINQLKHDVLTKKQSSLDCKEILMALSISAVTNPAADAAWKQLVQLRDLQAHSTVILQQSDENTFRQLGIMITSEPEFASDSLFYGN